MNKGSRKIICIIPARGGSKGIKNKNLVNLNELPLISYTINASLTSKYINETFVSSDSDEILNVAKNSKVQLLKREPHLALDDSKVVETVISIIVEKKLSPGTIIVLLQPTSPLRNAIHVDNAIEDYLKSGVQSLVSGIVVPHNFNPNQVYEINDDSIYNMLSEENSFQRQVKKKYIARNGAAIYISSVENILNYNSMFSDKTKVYLMNKISSIDIDEDEDLKIAEMHLLNQ